MAKSERTPKRTPKKRKKRLEKDRDWKPAFIAELAARGNVCEACRKAKVGRTTAYQARGSDAAFDAAWKESVEVAVEWMEAEARRRAVDGTLKPVYQGGKLVGKVREYSDTLLIFLLKAHKPEKYRDNAKVVVSGDPANPVQHEHSGTVSVVNRIDQLAGAFAGAADREEAGAVPGDGP